VSDLEQELSFEEQLESSKDPNEPPTEPSQEAEPTCEGNPRKKRALETASIEDSAIIYNPGNGNNREDSTSNPR